MHLFWLDGLFPRGNLNSCSSSSQVTSVRQEYQEKIKGLMPAELRQELEDTITSLKAQVRSAGIGVSKTVRGEVSALVVI